MEEAERLGRLEERMTTVEKGIANFRDFQNDSRDFQSSARDFFTEHRATEAEREKQVNLRDQEIKDALASYHETQETALAAYHTTQGNRQFWIMFAVGILGLLLMAGFGIFAIPPAIQSIKDLLKSDIHLPHIVRQEPAPGPAATNQPALDAQN
jgi:hypothetical protein